MKQKVLSRLANMCGDSLYCDIRDLEAICEEVQADHEVNTNEIIGRRRRRGTYHTSLDGEDEGEGGVEEVTVMKGIGNEFLNDIQPNDGRQVIEIVFRLVGRFTDLLSYFIL